MNAPDLKNLCLAALIAAGAGGGSAIAAESGASAAELASRLSDLRQDGTSSIRMRMEIRGESKTSLQLLVKQRRSKSATEVVYQVLWPKERKGEAVLLRKSANGPTSGTHFTPPNTIKPISDPGEALFGGDLAYEDVVDNFFGWDQQAVVGSEKIDGVECQVLESKPGKASSIYGSVKSWIDPHRMVPMRVDKFSTSGKQVRRIDTLRVVPSDGKQIPANLTVRGPGKGGGTVLDGSKIRYDVKFSDREFTPEGLKDISGAGPAGEAE
jgi:Outer membrane lipoprotein-sorting protein